MGHPYGLPPEECLVLVCHYIESLLVATRNRPTATVPAPPALPTPPDDTQSPPRRSMDYIAERPDGVIHSVLGEEYGIGVGYDEADLQRQRERITLRFSSKTIPKIPLLEYLDRIRKYNDVRTSMLLTLAIYLDRLEYPPLNEYTIHRVVLAGLRISAKFLEDLVWKHDRYAKVVGVSSRELSRLELGFLFLIDFEIVVNNEQLENMAFRLREGFGQGKVGEG